MTETDIVTSMLLTTVIARTKIEGIHRWSGCPIEQVSYLRDYHRHMFHIEARVKVTHPDRDVEFIELAHKIEQHLLINYYDEKLRLCNFGDSSCEMIAEELMNAFNLNYCEVNEDNEGGAVVERINV
jgi:hypothetical protein